LTLETKKVLNTLTIKSVSPDDYGKYTVRAKNEIGEAECTVLLSVDGKN
jgi:hypothetical protein